MTDIPPDLHDNPLLKDWRDTGDLPDFAAIRPEHFEPALRYAMQAEKDEIRAIARQRRAPDFDNTILALERTGDLLDRVSSIFHFLCGVASDEALQALEGKLSPLLSRHASWLFQHKALFARVDKVFNNRQALAPLQRRLVEEVHKSFVDSGAALPPDKRKALANLQAEEARMAARFNRNWTNQVKKPALLLSRESDLAGLPGFVREAAAEAARALGKPGKYAFMPTGPVTDNFLTYSSRRDLREKIYRAWASRNDGDDRYDNKPVAQHLLGLAADSARLLGYACPADYLLKDNMIKTPANAERLLRASWGPARAAYLAERDELQQAAAQAGQNEPIRPWDWRYYARLVQEQRFKLDDAEIKPYLSLENVREAAFAAAQALWGLTFSEVKSAQLHHEDARLWDVREADGRLIGRFIGDYFARPTKQQGAWMGELRRQYGMDGGQIPIVYNVCNFSRAPEGQPTLLSLEEAKTLFHELGHGLHGLLSQVEYPTLSGCNGPMDYVELPSQIFEKFLLSEQIMQTHLRHAGTGAPMPEALAQTIRAADQFCRGHAVMEYLASAVVDLALYRLEDARTTDLRAFEQATLLAWGLPEGGYMRHRLPHFSHIFGGGYSAAYHSYEQAAVLDTDAFAAFTERGNAFDAETAQRLRREIYATGAARDPLESYIAFRGRAPDMNALLASRGFTPAK